LHDKKKDSRSLSSFRLGSQTQNEKFKVRLSPQRKERNGMNYRKGKDTRFCKGNCHELSVVHLSFSFFQFFISQFPFISIVSTHTNKTKRKKESLFQTSSFLFSKRQQQQHLLFPSSSS